MMECLGEHTFPKQRLVKCENGICSQEKILRMFVLGYYFVQIVKFVQEPYSG